MMRPPRPRNPCTLNKKKEGGGKTPPLFYLLDVSKMSKPHLFTEPALVQQNDSDERKTDKYAGFMYLLMRGMLMTTSELIKLRNATSYAGYSSFYGDKITYKAFTWVINHVQSSRGPGPSSMGFTTEWKRHICFSEPYECFTSTAHCKRHRPMLRGCLMYTRLGRSGSRFVVI